MHTLKRILSFALALALVLGMTVPAGAEEVPEETVPPATEVPEGTAPATEPYEEPTEVPTEAPAEKPEEAPTEVPSEEPTEAPTEDPVEEPVESAEAGTRAAVASGTCGDNLTWVLDDSGTLTISGTGPMDDYDQFSSDSPWFDYRDNVKKVSIEDGVTTIGDYAFYLCDNFTSVTIPNSVTSIGDSAFEYCKSLTSMTIPNSVKTIGGAAFYYCTSLTSITIPNSVTTISNYAFYHCDSLTSITIPNSVKTIGYDAFGACDSLTSITIPNSVTSIGDSAFYYCTSLTSITIPNSVKTIGDSAFSDCESLTSVTIPNSVTSIGDGAFGSCTSLAGIYVASNNPNYSSDSSGVLFNKNKTTLIQAPGALPGSYIIPDSVTTINDYAFYHCKSLTCVTIPDNVTHIPSYAFSDCDNLAVVNIGNGVRTIKDYAFDACSSLTSVTIPEGVTTICYRAFNACSRLTSVTIPISVKTIDLQAFRKCYSITDIYYLGNESQWNQIDNNTVNELDPQNIRYCQASGACGTDLNWMLYDNGTLAIYGTGAMTSYASVSAAPWYSYVDSISTLVLEYGITSFGRHAFCGCTELTSVTIPGSVLCLNRQTFDGCKKLKSVTFTGRIPNLDVMAFYGCTGLDAVHITDLALWCNLDAGDSIANPLHYANNLYLNGKLVTDLVIPEGVTKINYFAFARCTSIKTLTLPASIETLAQGAFKDCDSLKYIVFRGDKPTIEDHRNGGWIGNPSAGGEYVAKSYGSFENVNAVAYYPYDADWGTGKIEPTHGGGQITWIGYDPALTVPAKPYKVANVVSGVHVYWNAVPGVSKYGLWRSDNGPNGYYKWIGNPKTNHFTDTKVESGKTYYYCVSTCDPNTNAHSMMSDPIGITYLSTPDITERLNRQPGIQLTWDQITGATGYRIYRKSYSGNDAWVKVGEVTGNDTLVWVDTSVQTQNGQMYRYTVRAVCNNTLSGCRSAGRSMMRLTGLTLKQVTKTGTGTVKVSWNTSKLADGYEIRFMNGNTIVKQFTIGNYKTGVKTFSGIPTGATYKVQVRRYVKVDGMGFYSAWSPAINIKL